MRNGAGEGPFPAIRWMIRRRVARGREARRETEREWGGRKRKKLTRVCSRAAQGVMTGEDRGKDDK